jgi:hypothetical protein
MSADHRQRIYVTRARRVSDGVALASHMKLTVGTLRSMTNYLAELAEIRAVLGTMIVTTMSADHRQTISVVRSKSFTNRLSSQIVLRGLANPPGSVDVIPTAGCTHALGALF